jgi:hypothetical protein
MIQSSFLALAVTTSRTACSALTARPAARHPAVDVAAIASSANRKDRSAISTELQPLIEHVLASSDFLAIICISSEGARVDASSRDMEGWEVVAPGLRFIAA